jgi:hypothetical protein
VLGRCDVDVPAAVETAAPGPGLNAVLDADGARARKLELIEETADWIGDLGEESRGAAAELAPEIARLDADVVAAWPAAPADLTRVLRDVDPVLAHHDAGSWNMVVTPTGVMVLDWESARYPAVPLWDLLYFLTDALVALRGQATDEEKVTRALALLRGDAAESPLLFGYLRRAMARFDVGVDVIGPVATLAWLHHGTSPARREARAAAVTEGDVDVGVGLLTRLAGPWLADPALGAGWPAFPR